MQYVAQSLKYITTTREKGEKGVFTRLKEQFFFLDYMTTSFPFQWPKHTVSV